MTGTGVLILGAGRSGTSTLARALIALGIEFGSQFKRPTRKNPRGFFEEANMLAISKQVRRAMGLRAEHVRLLTDADWQQADLTTLSQQMRVAIEQAMQDAQIWGFKYASTGRILPFWLPLLEEMAVQPAFVFAYRNPLSISASRKHLDPNRGIQQKSDLEWLANVVPYLHLTRGHPLVVVDYDRMIEAPGCQLERLSEGLGITADSQQKQEFTQEFVRPDLRHNRQAPAALAADNTLHPLVRRAATLLESLASSNGPPSDDFWLQWSDLRQTLYQSAGQHMLVDQLVDERRRARWWDLITPARKAWMSRPL